MSRKKNDPTAWRDTPQGIETYREARDRAQRDANLYGYDYGIEANDLFRYWHVFMLPSAANRSGHEVRCEVVHPMTEAKPGHGPSPTRAVVREVFNG